MTRKYKQIRPLPQAESRRLAVLASVDPRTIQKVLSGETVRGMAQTRAAEVLLSEGYLNPDADE